MERVLENLHMFARVDEANCSTSIVSCVYKYDLRNLHVDRHKLSYSKIDEVERGVVEFGVEVCAWSRAVKVALEDAGKLAKNYGL
jgi:hypothetical protein